MDSAPQPEADQVPEVVDLMDITVMMDIIDMEIGVENSIAMLVFHVIVRNKEFEKAKFL